MSKLLVTPSRQTRLIYHVRPESVRWTHVGFDFHLLRPGEAEAGETGDRELCLWRVWHAPDRSWIAPPPADGTAAR